MATEIWTMRRHVTPRYKNLTGKAAIAEYTLDLAFEVIYASAPRRGRKPHKRIKALIEQGRRGSVGHKESLENLCGQLFAVIRGKKEVDDLNALIKTYLHLG